VSIGGNLLIYSSNDNAPYFWDSISESFIKHKNIAWREEGLREKARRPMRQIAWYSGSYSVVIVVAILKKVFQYRIQYIPNDKSNFPQGLYLSSILYTEHTDVREH